MASSLAGPAMAPPKAPMRAASVPSAPPWPLRGLSPALVGDRWQLARAKPQRSDANFVTPTPTHSCSHYSCNYHHVQHQAEYFLDNRDTYLNNREPTKPKIPKFPHIQQNTKTIKTHNLQKSKPLERGWRLGREPQKQVSNVIVFFEFKRDCVVIDQIPIPQNHKTPQPKNQRLKPSQNLKKQL